MHNIANLLTPLDTPFFIAGPCAIESRSFALETAESLKEIFCKAGIPVLTNTHEPWQVKPAAEVVDEPSGSGMTFGDSRADERNVVD
jgi:3-deoxy-D-manno-octulosonic acid (KDO) 8-phosphate synthase